MRIAVVAPSSRFSDEAAARVQALAVAEFPAVEIVFHPQCFLEHNHFAGPDAARLAALVEVGNDPSFDAVWSARGGYGACRIAEAAVAQLGAKARDKAWVGYSDFGYVLAGLYRAGFPRLAHGAVAQDVLRPGGKAAVRRVLAWLTRGEQAPLPEPHAPVAAFNLTVLGLLLGTPLDPDLSGHVLMVEDVAEHSYRTDRAFFHLTGNPMFRRLAGLRLGRFTAVPDNDPAFGDDAEAIARFWCERAGVPFLGHADIGHDAENTVVGFGGR